jgi:hypothetical protein
MKIKQMIKRHAGLIIALVGVVVMFPVAALLCQIDVWLGAVGPDGDGPAPLLALQGAVLLFVVGIVIELVNPFEKSKRT